MDEIDTGTSGSGRSSHRNSGESGRPPLLRTTSIRSFTNAEKDKISAIRAACEAGDRGSLIQHAISADGLVSDDVRREAWPLLLATTVPRVSDAVDADCEHDTAAAEKIPERVPWEELPLHEDERQVQLDVDRSFIYYPTNMSPRQLDDRKKELSDLIVEVLRRHPMLGYFQGFHDICQVILLVMGPKAAVSAVEHIALLKIRDFMLPSMTPAINHLRLLYPLLNDEDPKLCAHLSRTQPFFALAATLTLYAHDIQEYSNIARLFDVFLALDPVFPLYLFTQIVMERKEELFEIPDDEPEMLHSILSKLPKPLDLEGWISRAILLVEKRPPEKLSTWRWVSKYSVLKTSRTTSPTLTLEAAEKIFSYQCQELKSAELRKQRLVALAKHKTPILVGLSVLIGVSSIALGMYARNHGGVGSLPGMTVVWRIFVAIRRLM